MGSLKKTLLLHFLFLLHLIFSSPIPYHQLEEDESIVKVQTGLIRGQVLPNARAFLGIPFAKPPVGTLRFAPPQAVAPWSGVLNTTKYTAGCPQHCDLPPFTCPLTYSEDCLYLNVWTPRLSSSATKLPVLLFLPGGHFDQSGAPIVLYNSDHVVNQTNSVIITTNFRLGFLGWGFTSKNTIRGNYGLEDQLLAMSWVQNNIAAFGGDPNQVTLFGQSAGATSTATQLVMLYHARLRYEQDKTATRTTPENYLQRTAAEAATATFQKAIIQSNPWSLTMNTPQSALRYGKVVAKQLSCALEDLDCFRAKSVEDIVNAQTVAAAHIDPLDALQTFYPWTPLIDGIYLEIDTFDGFAQGKFPTDIPIMMGSVANESIIFIYQGFPTKVSKTEYDLMILGIFGPINGPRVLKRYPSPEGADARLALFQLVTDYIFTCPTRVAATKVQTTNLAAQHQNMSWLYYFDHILSFKQGWGPNYTFCYNAVCHASELVFVYDSATEAGFNYTAGEDTLARSMYTHWTNFAKTGNPNLPLSTDTWYPYDQNMRLLQFSVPNKQLVALFNDTCNFWDTIGYHHNG